MRRITGEHRLVYRPKRAGPSNSTLAQCRYHY
ncbi:type II toxin-antitoxin system YoeB family toxin [Bradyrhizobium murdochi]|nr:type II toxin-antitoxin system YoeB family toxin [Bradyrhizobium murdochi]